MLSFITIEKHHRIFLIIFLYANTSNQRCIDHKFSFRQKIIDHNHSMILDRYIAQSRLQCIAKISTFAFDGWSSLVACPWFGSMTVVWLIVPIMINQHFFRRFYRLVQNLYVYIQIRIFIQMRVLVCARIFLLLRNLPAMMMMEEVNGFFMGLNGFFFCLCSEWEQYVRLEICEVVFSNVDIYPNSDRFFFETLLCFLMLYE